MEIVFSDKIHKSILCHNLHRLLIDVGEDQCDIFLLRTVCELMQRLHGACINGRYASHTDDNHLRVVIAVNA